MKIAWHTETFARTKRMRSLHETLASAFRGPATIEAQAEHAKAYFERLKANNPAIKIEELP